MHPGKSPLVELFYFHNNMNLHQKNPLQIAVYTGPGVIIRHQTRLHRHRRFDKHRGTLESIYQVNNF